MPLAKATSVAGGDHLLAGDIGRLVEIAGIAEDAALDAFVLPEHVLMGAATGAYPYGPFELPSTTEWPDPFVLLAAVAASTTKIRIATGIVIAPLRPAPVFAKSVATLDALSHGRLDLGVGAGWQRAEFEAAGIPFESRFARMDDTLNACLRLWQGGPVDFESATSSFHQVWCHPVPAQPGGPPIWFGGGTVGANARRIATLGSGWLPPGGATSEHVSAGVAGLRRYFTERGRDPAELRIRAVLPVRLGAAGPDLEATIATIPDFAAAGATTVVLPLAAFARTFEDVGLILRRFSEA